MIHFHTMHFQDLMIDCGWHDSVGMIVCVYPDVCELCPVDALVLIACLFLSPDLDTDIMSSYSWFE